MPLTQLELFAGIGGFGLAGHWAGIKTVCQIEIDPFCQKVLAKNFPNAKKHGDIKTFNGTEYRGTVDIISGGFPCQPYSSAGKRLGKEDERHLWPEMLRIIREVRPRWIVGENVFGLVNWSGGMVFDEVQSDLESEGYEVQAFVLPAAAVNAPHRRDRVWFVAYADEVVSRKRQLCKRTATEKYEQPFVATTKNAANTAQTNSEQPVSARTRRDGIAGGSVWNAANTAKGGGSSGTQDKIGKLGRQRFNKQDKRITWNEATSEPALCGVDDGVSAGLDKNRNKRIGALGNAIVPQVAYQIFASIVEYEKMQKKID